MCELFWDIYTIEFLKDVKIINVEDFCLTLVGENSPCNFVGCVNKINDTHFLLNIIDTNNYDTMDIEVFEEEVIINLCNEAENVDSVNRVLEYCKSCVNPTAHISAHEESSVMIG
jgi:hypothetical protein